MPPATKRERRVFLVGSWEGLGTVTKIIISSMATLHEGNQLRLMELSPLGFRELDLELTSKLPSVKPN